MLGIVIVVHITAGATAVLCGAAAMLAPKRAGRHPHLGRAYLTALGVVFATAVAIVAARPHTAYLLILGTIALTAATAGFLARRRHRPGWLRRHIAGMAFSYTALLTAFYVDNGPRLPLWRLLPPLAFWFLPAAVAVPLLLRAVRRHTMRRPQQAPPHTARPPTAPTRDFGAP
ncbi:hypothetical protein [Yinghuangia seranimata]|uniref:hypothetical protein n=1 Tax=Yinghuangia seranimata TaxID=408067 RepID=UPI00248C70C7|nr:hypothetical protein [Yinghuangia seranimata]MDI2130144.1 hypothetical protein [Yinghuangia seranimata]